MASTDPDIILAAGNINDPGKQEQGLISMFSLAQAVRKANQEQQRTNALRNIFTNPASVDANTGLPTPQAIRGIMTVDPEMGVKLQDDALAAQVRRAQAQHYQTEAGKNNFDFMSSAAGIGYDAYAAAKKAGKSEQDAIAAGTAARNDAVKNNGGVIGDDIANGIMGKPFDPAGARALAGANKEWSTRMSQEAAQERQDKATAERERHDIAMEEHGDKALAAALSRSEEGKWQILHDSKTGSDYRYNPETTQATTLDGKPYTPQSAAKVGSGGAEFTPKMGELMAATAEQGVSIPTGFRSKAQQIQLYQGLLDRNPDKTPDEIAKMLKTGQIEFGAQKKETQTAAGIAGKVEVAANELNRFVPLVRKASADLERSDFKTLNKLVQTADSEISDPKLKTLKGYIVGTLNAYDVLAARGGTDKEKRAENREQLLSAEGDRAINAALDVIMKESQIAHESSVEATRVPELETSPKKGGASGSKVLRYDTQGNLVQ